MIDEGLRYIRVEVKDFLGVQDTEVMVGNVQVLKEGNNRGAYLSLINVEEETTMKNGEHYIRQNNQIRYQEPPIFINLYVLCAFDFENYNTSLLRLSQTTELFQSKRVFSSENQRPGNPFPTGLEKLIFDYYNLNFEQLNHLWGVLGSPYLPSLYYKIRMMKIQRNVTTAGPEISSIHVGTTLQ